MSKPAQLLDERAIVQRLQASFMVGCESSRGGHFASETELLAISRWAGETIGRWVALQDILSGKKIVELDGDRPCIRAPTSEESTRLADLGLTR
jgi:hypothetical protein